MIEKILLNETTKLTSHFHEAIIGRSSIRTYNMNRRQIFSREDLLFPNCILASCYRFLQPLRECRLGAIATTIMATPITATISFANFFTIFRWTPRENVRFVDRAFNYA